MKLKAKRFMIAFLAALMLVVSVPGLPMANLMVYADGEESNEAALEKLKYDGEDIKFVRDDLTSTFGMLSPQGGSTWEIDGDKVVIHIVPSNKTVYGWLHWGKITGEELTKDVTINSDGTLDLTLDKSWCGYAHPVAPIKKKDGNTTAAQYYLAIPPEDKIPVKEREPEPADYTALDKAIEDAEAIDKTKYTEETVSSLEEALDEAKAVSRDLKEDSQADIDSAASKLQEAVNALKEKPVVPDPVPDKKVNLHPINDELMFKVVNAYLETKDGKTELVFSVSAKGYEDMIQGTQEAALAKGADKSDWVHYNTAVVECIYTDKKGEHNDGTLEKYQFRIPVTVAETGKTKLPIISVSDKEAKAAESANPAAPDYSKAFKARQFVIDMDAKTLHTGNYEESNKYAVESQIKSFNVDEEAEVYIFGTAASNEYIITPTLVMKDDTYDKAYIGSSEDAAVATDKVISIEGSKISIKFYNSHDDGTKMIDGKNPITVAFHVVKTGEWVERKFSIDVDAKKITVTGDEIKTEDEIKETPASYKKVEEAKAEAEKIDLDIFTDGSVKKLNDALDKVIENLTADKQNEVNLMAEDITDAIKGLILKDGIYTIPKRSLGNDMLDVVIEVSGGEMQAYITMTGRVQDKIYHGKAADAEDEAATEKIGGAKNSTGTPGASLFKMPIERLNDILDLSIHTPDGWSDRPTEIKASAIKKAGYEIIENKDGKCVKGEEFTLTSDAEFGKFAAVIMDDKVLDTANYTVVSGSTKVTLKDAYTETLSEGNHEIAILSHDGIAKTKITVLNDAVKEDPKAESSKPGSDNKTPEMNNPSNPNSPNSPSNQPEIKPNNTDAKPNNTDAKPNNTNNQQETKANNTSNQQANRSVRTGDENNLMTYVIILVASAIILSILHKRKSFKK